MENAIMRATNDIREDGWKLHSSTYFAHANSIYRAYACRPTESAVRAHTFTWGAATTTREMCADKRPLRRDTHTHNTHAPGCALSLVSSSCRTTRTAPPVYTFMFIWLCVFFRCCWCTGRNTPITPHIGATHNTYC